MRTVSRFGRILVRALPLLALGCTHGGNSRTVPDGVWLLRCTPQRESVAIAVAQMTGDSLTVRGHTLALPPGTLPRAKRFRMDDRTDGHVGVEIRPHGFRFSAPARLTLSYAQCESLAVDARQLKIYYVDDDNDVLAELPSQVDTVAKTVTTGRIDHLSGYLIGGT